MKIALLYFTGTYNTLYLTTLLKNMLQNRNNLVDVFVLNDKLNFKYNSYDYIGIGYPIHAFNAPKIVEKVLKKLQIKKKKYFIYKNSGEPFKLNDASSYKIYKIMKKNNNILLGEYHYLMPYNILFPIKKEFINLEMQYNLKYLNYMVDHLKETKKYHVNLWSRFISFVFKIQRLGCKINSKFYKVDKEKCVRCRLCQKNCPTNNIVYDKEKRKIVFKNNCLMCMRCSFNCKSKAISIGLLNKQKVTRYYNLTKIMNTHYDYDFSLEKNKFYKKFKKYFAYIDKLTNNSLKHDSVPSK